MPRFLISSACSYDRKTGHDGHGQISPPVSPGRVLDETEEQIPEVSSVIRLQNGMVLYLREINKYVLSCVCWCVLLIAVTQIPRIDLSHAQGGHRKAGTGRLQRADIPDGAAKGFRAWRDRCQIDRRKCRGCRRCRRNMGAWGRYILIPSLLSFVRSMLVWFFIRFYAMINSLRLELGTGS